MAAMTDMKVVIAAVERNVLDRVIRRVAVAMMAVCLFFATYLTRSRRMDDSGTAPSVMACRLFDWLMTTAPWTRRPEHWVEFTAPLAGERFSHLRCPNRGVRSPLFRLGPIADWDRELPQRE